MPRSLPIACTLTGDEVQGRIHEMKGVGRAGLMAVDEDETEVTLRFRPDSRLRERLSAIVAAEARCCAFLDLTLRDEPEATLLTIKAQPGGEPVMHGIAEAFAAGQAA